MIPICPYCKKESILTDSSTIYGSSYGMIYLCAPCNAYVGVHKGTETPLGSLANKELREIRKEAHKYFDGLWRKKMRVCNLSKIKARGKAYKWLSEQLGINVIDTHIGMFGIEKCNETIKICKQLKK